MRRVLAIDPGRGPAVKRVEHEVVVGASAESFADALTSELEQPGARFGLIQVRRARDKEFVVGERFHGALSLAGLAARWAVRGRRRFLATVIGVLGATRAGAWIEDNFLSDYAEIVEVSRHKVVYRYLSGSPMAGSSTFLVEPLGDRRCRFRVVFEWQERGALAIDVLHRFGLQVHDEVTAVQARRAAQRIGAAIESSTIFTAPGAAVT